MTDLYLGVLDDLPALDGQPANVVLLDDSYVFDAAQANLAEVTGTEIGRDPVTLAIVADATAGTRTLYIVDSVSIPNPAETNTAGWCVALDAVDDADAALVAFQSDASSADPYTLGALTALVQIRTAVAAADVAYTPSDAGDWSPVPGTVAAALDQVASRLADLEAP